MIQNFEWNYYLYLYKTALYFAIEYNNIDILKHLLTNDKIDINAFTVQIIFYLKNS